MEVQYRKLNDDNFNQNTLDGFIRHQAVKECWRKIDSVWQLVPNVFEENWSLRECSWNMRFMTYRRIGEDTGCQGVFLRQTM